MFGSSVLEVGIGLAFVYLFLSLLCSTINEQVIARFFNLRANTLQDGIKNMLADPQGDKLVNDLYDNPLIKGLSQNAASGKPRKPSYIPADIFAVALMSTAVVQAYKKDPNTASIPIPKALELVIKNANNDTAKELADIEKWYNSTMDRVSGWYKREVQLIIFALGLVITVGLNIDTISFIASLSNNTVIRASIVSAAQGAAATQPSAGFAGLQRVFEQIQPVIGWSTSTLPADFWGWVLKIVGLLATTFAVSLGAPFWFDVLNKFVSFRSSGALPQTSAGTAGSPITTVQLVAGATASPSAITQPAVSTDGSTGAPSNP
jgi:hypothetical protein